MEVDGVSGVGNPDGQSGEQESDVVAQAENILRDLSRQLNEGGRAEHRVAWDRMTDPSVMTTLAEAWFTDEARTSVLITSIEMIPRQVQRARSLRRAIQNLASEIQRRRSAELLSDIEDQLGELPTLDVTPRS